LASPRSQSDWNHYEKDEVQSLLANWFLDGMKQTEALQKLRDEYRVNITANQAKNEMRKAREKRKLVYVPGHNEKLARALGAHLKGVGGESRDHPSNVRIVTTSHPSDVAHAGASLLCEEIVRHFEYDKGRERLHIGFAGGRTPSLMAEAMAEFLMDPDRWPDWIVDSEPRKVLVFHSLVGNMNPHTPEVDPNAFLVYLAAAANGPLASEVPFALHFSSMPAPGVVTVEEYERLRGGVDKGGLAMVQAAFERRKLLDIVVASCGHWGPEHRSIHGYLSAACASDEGLRALWEETAAELDKLGVIGDMMWAPILPDRPVDAGDLANVRLRVLSLFDFGELVEFVHPSPTRGSKLAVNGGKVMLLVGPCSGAACPERSKGDLLATVLKMERPPVTHLVADSRTARTSLKRLGKPLQPSD
jgi:hypothetical protein